MHHAAEVKATAQDREAEDCAIPSDSPKAQSRAALAAGVHSVGATKTLVWGNVALICTDGGKDKCAHERSVAYIKSGRRVSAGFCLNTGLGCLLRKPEPR